MQLEFIPANNLLRLFGSTTTTLWKIQQNQDDYSGIFSNYDKSYLDQFAYQCLYLKLFYYHCKTFNIDSV